MIELNELTALAVVPALIICMCVGWAWKHLTANDNKYIPVVMMVLGAVLSCIYFRNIELMSIGAGMITGIASCGMHDLIDNLMNGASNGCRPDIEMSDTEALEFIEEHPELFQDEEE